MNETLYILKDTTDPNFPRESRSWVVTSTHKTIDRIYGTVLISGNISVKLGDCIYIEDEEDNSLMFITCNKHFHLGHKYVFAQVSAYDVVREVEVIRMPKEYNVELTVCEFTTDCNQAFLTIDTPTGHLGVEPHISHIENCQTIICFIDTDGDEWILKPTGKVTLCPFMKL